jgi:hypothetical protein
MVEEYGFYDAFKLGYFIGTACIVVAAAAFALLYGVCIGFSQVLFGNRGVRRLHNTLKTSGAFASIEQVENEIEEQITIRSQMAWRSSDGLAKVPEFDRVILQPLRASRNKLVLELLDGELRCLYDEVSQGIERLRCIELSLEVGSDFDSVESAINSTSEQIRTALKKAQILLDDYDGYGSFQRYVDMAFGQCIAGEEATLVNAYEAGFSSGPCSFSLTNEMDAVVSKRVRKLLAEVYRVKYADAA